MFPQIDPKKMNALMKQMGMSQTEIDAKRVIIECENKNIIIDNPSVMKVKMQGQESFQISGEIAESGDKERGEDYEETEDNEKEQLEKDIEIIKEKTGKDDEEIAITLEKNNGDIAKTILELSE